jgi:hypothetical protein
MVPITVYVCVSTTKYETMVVVGTEDPVDRPMGRQSSGLDVQTANRNGHGPH